jgi:hypothetical protein
VTAKKCRHRRRWSLVIDDRPYEGRAYRVQWCRDCGSLKRYISARWLWVAPGSELAEWGGHFSVWYGYRDHLEPQR